MNLSCFPILNASLNAASAVLLLAAFGFIKAKRYVAHGVLMIIALATSSAFLASYLTYHYLRWKQGIAVTRFPDGSLKPWYITLLISHTILAVVILPLILLTLRAAWQRKWAMHRRLATWTLPLWFYVSVTGVVIYWMLYHVAPTL